VNTWGFPMGYSPLNGEPVRVVIPLRGSAQEFKAAYVVEGFSFHMPRAVTAWSVLYPPSD
jgi:hypothetical protein